MNTKERMKAALRYQKYDRLPVIQFGYWQETLEKWRSEGHLTREESTGWADGNAVDDKISAKLGFDCGWNCFVTKTDLFPGFETKVVRRFADGTRHVQNRDGVVVIEKDGTGAIPSEVGHLLTDRKSWEEHYLPRLQFSPERVDANMLHNRTATEGYENPIGIWCGSLFGRIRDWMGIEGVSYLYADDEKLYEEIIDTVANLCYRVVEQTLSAGVKFDFAAFWEDICFKNGPLVIPDVFKLLVGPHYKKITSLLTRNGIDIISVDCDGVIDSLVPIWLENGVNTMFPIEVGVWNASIKPWREKYGKELRGVGGMNKNVFARDYAAVDAEIERLRPLVALGGYIPCPDHRIAPDAKWENVQYYCERMRETF
ncbi:MAG: hypothetical protein M0R40_06545 [Firmicutes bacterium]|nr:hypothetical protein [Bacillota bacterium]